MCIDSRQFRSDVHNDLICPICLGVLCVDCLVDENDHAYCKKCIVRWLRKGNSKCPIGNENIDRNRLKPIIRIVKNILSDLKVCCQYQVVGCTKVMKHEDYYKHENECQFRPIKFSKSVRDKSNIKPIHKNGIELNGIISNKISSIPAESICSMFRFSDDELIVTDIGASSLIIVDYEGNLLNEPFNPDNLLDDPLSICVSSNREIYVGDSKQFKIFVFDSSFRYKCEFGDEDTLGVPNYIRCDVEQNDELYVSHYNTNLVTVWDNYILAHRIDIEAPLDIAISKDNFYISSAIRFEVKEDAPNELKNINNGLNSIFILSKLTFEVLKTIQMNWLSPGGLFLDSNLNIYTVAYELNEEKYKSEFKYLFIIDKNGNCLKKIQLDELKGITDMVVVDDKIMFCADQNCIRTFQFDFNA